MRETTGSDREQAARGQDTGGTAARDPTGSRRVARVSSLAEQGRERDGDATTAAGRLLMVWPITLDAWAFAGGTDAESRLPRHVVRIRRGGR